jgi:hypothetical protein
MDLVDGSSAHRITEAIIAQAFHALNFFVTPHFHQPQRMMSVDQVECSRYHLRSVPFHIALYNAGPRETARNQSVDRVHRNLLALVRKGRERMLEWSRHAHVSCAAIVCQSDSMSGDIRQLGALDGQEQGPEVVTQWFEGVHLAIDADESGELKGVLTRVCADVSYDVARVHKIR